MTEEEFWACTEDGDFRVVVVGVGSNVNYLRGTFHKYYVHVAAPFVRFTGEVGSPTTSAVTFMDRWDVPLDMIRSVL